MGRVPPEPTIRVLASLAVRTPAGDGALGPPLRRAVLAVLLAHRGALVSSDALVGQL